MAGGSVSMNWVLSRRSPWNALRDLWEREAAAWMLSGSMATAIAAAPLIVAGAIRATHPVHRLYQFLTTEDSFIEWIQVAALLGTVIATALVAYQLRRSGRRVWAMLYLLAALGAFFCAGEEISWGQRVFGWTTPQELWEINAQGETNIHNIRPHLFNAAILVVSFYLTIAPLVVALARRLRRAWPDTSLFVPPLVVVTSFALTFVYRLYRLLLHHDDSGSFAEVAELSLYMGAMTYAVLLFQRLRAAGTAGFRGR